MAERPFKPKTLPEINEILAQKGCAPISEKAFKRNPVSGYIASKSKAKAKNIPDLFRDLDPLSADAAARQRAVTNVQNLVGHLVPDWQEPDIGLRFATPDEVRQFRRIVQSPGHPKYQQLLRAAQAACVRPSSFELHWEHDGPLSLGGITDFLDQAGEKGLLRATGHNSRKLIQRKLKPVIDAFEGKTPGLLAEFDPKATK